MTVNPGDDPSLKRADVVNMQTRAHVCNALSGGTLGMRAEGKRYLPQEPAETPKAYSIRLAKTVLFPAFKKAISTMVGKPFGKPLSLGNDVPAPIKGYCQNIDLAARDLDTFARDVFQQTMTDGIGWILIDYQNTRKIAEERGKDKLSLEEERALGVRPYWIHIPLEKVLGWRSDIVDGRHQLTQFRFEETVEEPFGDFGFSTVRRIRVWEIGNVRVYLWDAKNKAWNLDTANSGPVTLQEIPIVTCYTGRTGYLAAEPPLEDLAWLNVEHWQSRSDQRHILHFARVPILFGKDLTTDPNTGKVVLGGDRLMTGGPNSDLKVVEHTGAAIEAGRMDLQDIEAAMQRVAGELLKSEVQKTATESDREAGEGESQLRKWLKTFQQNLMEALRITGLWIGEASGGSLTLAMDWDEAEISADLMVALTNAVNAGVMSRDTAIWNFKRKGMLPPDRTVQNELAKIEHEAAPPGGGLGNGVGLSAMDRLKGRSAALAQANGKDPAEGAA